MRDPFAWSLPFGRLFGITIRVHILFPFIFLAVLLRTSVSKDAASGAWIDAFVMLTILFFCVLLHEFGHCYGAHISGGTPDKVLLWPLGGLASSDIPHTPRAHFVTTIMGPAVNFFLAILAAIVLWSVYGLQPRWDPLTFLARDDAGLMHLKTWSGETQSFSPLSAPVLWTHFFWVNYLGFLLNMVLIGYPMDGGQLFQSVAWKYVGYHRGTLMAIYAGYVTMLLVGLAAIVMNDVLCLCLALFIYFSCSQKHVQLEQGREDSLFGYDFSQGYTSLERDDQEEEEPKPKKPRKSWWQRWKQKRAEKKRLKEEARKKEEEERLDELLEKINREGSDSLTDEERRFMKQASERYRNKQ